MGLKNISRQVFFSGAILIWIIKLFIRPLHHFDEPVRFMLGIAPNLLGSFCIPFAAYWLFSGRGNLFARIFRIQSTYDLRIVCLLGMGMLIVNEYLQLIPVFGRTFDIYDIIFSLLGLSISYFVFERLRLRYQLQSA